MQFLKSAVLFVVAFATVALATPKPQECKPLLQSCSDDWECCSDLCVLGVSLFTTVYVESSF